MRKKREWIRKENRMRDRKKSREYGISIKVNKDVVCERWKRGINTLHRTNTCHTFHFISFLWTWLLTNAETIFCTRFGIRNKFNYNVYQFCMRNMKYGWVCKTSWTIQFKCISQRQAGWKRNAFPTMQDFVWNMLHMWVYLSDLNIYTCNQPTITMSSNGLISFTTHNEWAKLFQTYA